MQQHQKETAGQFLLIFAVLCLSAILFGQQSAIISKGDVLLPAQQKMEIASDMSVQKQMTVSKRWQSFVQKHGPWSVQWNEATRTPHRAFGKGISIDGYTNITAGNVETASRSFLNRNSKMMGINTADLEMSRAQKINNRWYVSFVQKVEDIQVLFSEVELRIFENGNVMSFGADFYPQIDIALTPTISFDEAKQLAVTNLEFNAAKDAASGEETLYILPIKEDRNLSYHLVYKANVKTIAPVGNFIVLVDAHTGEVLWRHNLVRSLDVRNRGNIHPTQPTDTPVSRNFANQEIIIDGVTFITDENGIISPTINQNANFTARLQGPFVNVNRRDAADAIMSGTISPGGTVTLNWDDSNSHSAERDAFYHTNIVHDFITALDPNFTRINYSMPCAVNINDACNAFFDGTGINFFLSGGGCANTGEIASVVYHEYGHAINHQLYIQAGSPVGMVNGAIHEGLADVVAIFLEDHPIMGRGFSGPGTFVRNADNTRCYPEDIIGEVHIDGLIIAGAFWDLREATSLETANRLSHFAKYGTPDDPNTGIAFAEWFVEVLVADDNDGDISNGTPNFSAINEAFNKHGIGSNLFMTLSFDHTPFPDTPDVSNSYPIIFHLEGFDVTGGQPDSLKVHYSTDNFQTIFSIDAAAIGNNNYRAEIPPQSAGDEVEYFITAFDPLSNTNLRFPGTTSSFGFLVGFTSTHFDPLEGETGWIIGDLEDDATTGIWQRGNPQATSVGSQPEDDNTPNGSFCFVTGAQAGGAAGAFDVDDGRTTLFSPIYDLSAINNPVLRYYRWYSNNRGATPGTDFWKVDISNNGGQTWHSLENTRESTDGWEKFQVKVSDVVEPTNAIQLRFIASDLGQGSLVEALVDDIEILAQSVVTGIEDNEATLGLPEEFALAQNYPNPFNPATTIDFALPNNARISIKIFNLLGQEVRTLVTEERSAGRYSVVWDGKNAFGNPVASGLYIYKMEAVSFGGGAKQSFIQARKLMLLK